MEVAADKLNHLNAALEQEAAQGLRDIARSGDGDSAATQVQLSG
jgi:hypothetical protein